MRTGCDGTIRRLGRIGMLWLLAGLGMATAHAATLDPALLPKIQAATFEVVEAKPTVDPLSYEKPLPLDLLPYQERTDKYHSIGTAFAIGHGRYVTAGHVLLAGLGGLWGAPELRDGAGHVYPIGKIEKFDLRKDFVVFTLAQPPAGDAALPVDSKPTLNQVVYAVGNALGTGVVIRDGLYTSDTPEQQDGAWKWMRFSAAASPGNSGGPLLDQDGKAIGVVLMKSANENLNYALPMSEVLGAPDRLAVIDRREPYQFDLFDTTITGSFKAQFALPLGLADFYARYLKLQQAYADEQLKTLLAKEAERTFPNGAGSSRLLHDTVQLDDMPTLIHRDGAGNWDLTVSRGPRIPLPDNGYVTVGLVGGNLLFHLRKPDSVTAAQLYTDPKRMMDMLTGLGFVHRTVGTERVKITSLGKPTLDTLHTDRWQRRWQVRVWPVPYENGKTVVLTLPVPDGYVGMLRSLPAGREHDYLINLEAMADFFHAAYDGSLEQWQDYLKNTNLLPAAFAHIKLGIAYGQRFSFASPRVSFAYTPALQQIARDSELTLGFGFLLDHGKVDWGVGDVQVTEHADHRSTVNVQRNVAPSAELDKNYTIRWNRLVQRQHPFDGVARVDNDVSKITVVAGAPSPDAAVLWTAFYSLEGSHPQADMKARLDQLTRDMQVQEH